MQVKNRWAGLRTFSPDNLPLIGQGPEEQNFYWAAGLGGAGIQTAPAVGQAIATVVTKSAIEGKMGTLELSLDELSPVRLSKKATSTDFNVLAY